MSWTWSERLAATSLASFVALASGSVIGPGCASAPSGDGDAAVDAGDASLDAASDTADGGVPFDVGSDGRGDAGTFEASVPPDAGPPPEVACSADGGSDGDAEAGRDPCPLPVSTCVDHWLVTYLNGVCVDGRCEFVRVIKDCRDEGGSGCFAFAEGARCTFPVGK